MINIKFKNIRIFCCILLFGYLLFVENIANTASSISNKDDGALLETGHGIENTETVTTPKVSRTKEETERLETFGHELFDKKLQGLEKGGFRIKTADVFDRFGKPEIKSVESFRHRDPPPGKPGMYEIITWQFPGMLIEAGSYPPSETHEPEQVWFKRVDITNPDYTLKHKLKIGQPISEFISVLGQPNVRDKNEIVYNVTKETKIKPSVIEFDSFRIHMAVGPDQAVEKIEWTWEGVE